MQRDIAGLGVLRRPGKSALPSELSAHVRVHLVWKWPPLLRYVVQRFRRGPGVLKPVRHDMLPRILQVHLQRRRLLRVRREHRDDRVRLGGAGHVLRRVRRVSPLSRELG